MAWPAAPTVVLLALEFLLFFLFDAFIADLVGTDIDRRGEIVEVEAGAG